MTSKIDPCNHKYVTMNNLPNTKKSFGFTLVELIVVVGILAVILGVVLVALNPQRRFEEANNARRQSDVSAILNAIHSSIADTRGTVPAGLGTAARQLSTGALATCNNTTACSTGTDACLDLTTALAGYIGTIPCDPGVTCVSGTPAQSRYTAARDANGIITIAACDAQGGDVIQAIR